MACATLVACATNQAPAARASAAVGQAAVKPGADLQSVLNSGADLVLQQGAVYEISEPLIYKKRGQKIFTRDARTPSQFATLRLANKNVTRLVYAGGIEGAVMEHVILDGQRYTLSIRSKADTGGVTQPSLVYFGGNRGDNQLVRECVFLNARSWSTLKVHEGASNVLVENNFIFGAGSDVRGNGREESEQYLKWGDGISFASRDSIIRNNLVIDSTDVGIVLFGSPGTIAEDNVVAS